MASDLENSLFFMEQALASGKRIVRGEQNPPEEKLHHTNNIQTSQSSISNPTPTTTMVQLKSCDSGWLPQHVLPSPSKPSEWP